MQPATAAAEQQHHWQLPLPLALAFCVVLRAHITQQLCHGIHG